MAHSGGGGSHSGGFSGSSSSHSGGSHSGGSSVRTQDTYFKGSTKYVIYDRHNPAKIIYSSSRNYHNETTKSQLLFGLFFVSIYLIAGLSAFITGLTHITRSVYSFPIDPPVDKIITVYDPYDFIPDTEEEALENQMFSFFMKTGVVPNVLLTYDKFWYEDYKNNFDTYALESYYNRFDDEKHLLFIYSYGAKNNTTGFEEFHWESIYGDDTLPTIGYKREEDFGKIFQKHLTRANGNEVGFALANAFQEITNNEINGIKLSNIAVDGIIEAVIGSIFTTLSLMVIIIMMKGYKRSKDKKTVKVPENSESRTCEYCGCLYFTNTISSCYHCGAPIPAK